MWISSALVAPARTTAWWTSVAVADERSSGARVDRNDPLLGELVSLRVGDVRPDGTLHVMGKGATLTWEVVIKELSYDMRSDNPLLYFYSITLKRVRDYARVDPGDAATIGDPAHSPIVLRRASPSEHTPPPRTRLTRDHRSP